MSFIQIDLPERLPEIVETHPGDLFKYTIQSHKFQRQSDTKIVKLVCRRQQYPKRNYKTIEDQCITQPILLILQSMIPKI